MEEGENLEQTCGSVEKERKGKDGLGEASRYICCPVAAFTGIQTPRREVEMMGIKVSSFSVDYILDLIKHRNAA